MKTGDPPIILQVLEETGIWPRIRRLAGTSSGAMAAAFLSVGYDSRGLDDIMSDDISDVFQGQWSTRRRVKHTDVQHA